jgi:hypothetical protein
MKKTFITAAAALTLGVSALTALAQAQPSSHEATIAWGDKNTEWAVPALENGCLWSVQIGGVTNGATVAVKHIVPYGTGLYWTNTVEAAAANGTLYTYSPWPVYTNAVQIAKPTLLVPGDRLLFTLSATNTSAAAVIRTGVR